MKRALILMISLSIIGCGLPLDLTELEEEEKEKFEKLSLQSGYELEDLRIDIIRQEISTQDSDGNSSTEEVDYHPLGFNIGNGLFYDLNGNLSLKAKELLNISTATYEIKTIGNVKKGSRIWVKHKTEEQICEEWQTKSGIVKKALCKEIKKEGQELSITRKGRFCYKIVMTKDSLRYTKTKKGLRWTTIEQVGDNSYKIKRGKKEKEFKQNGEEVVLNSRYLIKREAEGKRIEIYETRRYKNKLLYTIEKEMENIYVYDNKAYGYKIEKTQKDLVVYENKRARYKFERMK